ncbi:hypothetical protein LZ30DRAFT_778752 [Colletotrichum cereale]|nr:hypothetical protein LZ30DRAFT_778752 [Colletotrichum cereale]
MDPGACDAAAGHLGFYLWKGLMEEKKVKELGPAAMETVDEHAAAQASGTDSAHGRRTFGRCKLAAGDANREEEVCVGRVTPVTHFTMGGGRDHRWHPRRQPPGRLVVVGVRGSREDSRPASGKGAPMAS